MPLRCRLKFLRGLKARPNIWYAPGLTHPSPSSLCCWVGPWWGPPSGFFIFTQCLDVRLSLTLRVLQQRREAELLKCGLGPVLAGMHTEPSPPLGDRCASGPKKLDLKRGYRCPSEACDQSTNCHQSKGWLGDLF